VFILLGIASVLLGTGVLKDIFIVFAGILLGNSQMAPPAHNYDRNSSGNPLAFLTWIETIRGII